MKEMYALFVIVGLAITITYLCLAMSAYVKQTGKAKMRFIVSGVFGLVFIVGILGTAAGLPEQQPESSAEVTKTYTEEVGLPQSKEPTLIEQAKNKSDNEQDSNITTENRKIIYSLDITPEQFQMKFNSLPRTEGFENTTIESITLDTAADASNSFQEPLSYNVDVFALVNKSDDTIAYIQVALKHEGNDRDKDIFTHTIPLLISSTVPSVSDSKVEEILMKAIDNLFSDTKGIEILDGDYIFSTSNTAFARIFRISKEIN
ncbi:hypothetical protein [Paenibacillus xylanexedens]|uniref:hypothetical protein n=1 Tax=Paenibacillus xylanexedens TaxID=528191 RepID=UPI001B3AB07B|nr:hypothetical protein [Paenibacillus xylanexedens]